MDQTIILRAYNYNYVSPTATSFLLILLVIDLVFTLRHYNLQKFNLSFTSTPSHQDRRAPPATLLLETFNRREVSTPSRRSPP